MFPVGGALMFSPGGERRSLTFSLHPLCHSARSTTSKVSERGCSPLLFRGISRVAGLASKFDFISLVLPFCRQEETQEASARVLVVCYIYQRRTN